MVHLTNETVDSWLCDCAMFCREFQKYSFEWHHAVGADLDLLASEIEAAHSEWVATVTEWQTKRFRQETESLSYTKIFAILLWALSSRTFIGDMREYEPFRRPAPEFSGTEEDRKALLDDLLGAPEAVSALQFCISVLNFYEERRTDRATAFEFRMTDSGRHDLLVMLSSEEVTPMAVYLSLEGIYSRD